MAGKLCGGLSSFSVFSFLLLLLPQGHWSFYIVDGPALPNRPFVTVWNGKSDVCKEKWNVTIDLSMFDVVANRDQSWHGDFMNIFYSDQLGLYPYFDADGKAVRGGLPQLANLTAHLEKCIDDINLIIPDEDFRGLAVIDWESWRPLFCRNFDSLTIYKTKSEELVRQRHPTWSKEQIEEESQKEFDNAAKNFFESTVLLGRKLRPNAFWGYYHFPYCFDYHYTPEVGWDCSNKTKVLNTHLSWLFNASSTLYPSVYIPDSKLINTTAFVGYRLKEAFRLAKNGDAETPVFAYVRIVYARSELFLNQEDLQVVLGLPASMGSSGIVIWGSGTDTCTYEGCYQLKLFVENTMGPLIKNITKTTTECSQKYCSGHGRCTKKFDGTSQSFLNLDNFDNQIICKCYKGWRGADCSQPVFT